MTKAQKKAKSIYQKKLSRVVIDFYLKDSDLVAHLNSHSSKQGYIKGLIKKDVESREKSEKTT